MTAARTTVTVGVAGMTTRTAKVLTGIDDDDDGDDDGDGGEDDDGDVSPFPFFSQSPKLEFQNP